MSKYLKGKNLPFGVYIDWDTDGCYVLIAQN